jgi:hypothetical protein
MGQCNNPIMPATALCCCLLSGCAQVGPASVHGGRLAYSEAIIETDNQQMLLLAVRNRYGERSNLLAVSSVTANVRVATDVGIQAGAGDSDNYAGNLVPFSAGVVYEENPTISYTPVDGEQYARRVMSPVALASLAQFSENLADPAPVYYALVTSINGIYNPDFRDASAAPDTRFTRLVSIMTALSRAHLLHWVQDPKQQDRFSITIDRYAPAYADEVSELLMLLEIPAPENASSKIILPVSLAAGRGDTGKISITTRSVYQLLEILSGAVEVPEQDRASGVAVEYPPPGLVGARLKVHYAHGRPNRASVAVKYRDGWFYIDGDDQSTKLFFRFVTTLLSIEMAESTDSASATPVLTVPVSR